MSSCQSLNDDVFGPFVHGCRSNFDFTLLFEQSILTIGPAALLLIFAPPRLLKLLKSSNKTLPSNLRFFKATLAVLFTGIQLGLLICWSTNPVTRASIPSAVLSFLAALAILFLSLVEHSRSIQPSFILGVYLLASVAFDAVQARTLYLRHDRPVILGLFTANIAVKLVLLALESRSKRQSLKAPYRNYSPEATSGIFNRSFFWWLNPILAKGFQDFITLNDLFVTDVSLKSEVLLEEIQVSWSKYQSSGKYALVLTIFHLLRWKLAAIIFPRLCLIGFNYAQPFLISSAINFVSELNETRNKNDGYGLIAATALIYTGSAISTTHYKHHVNRSITAFRGAMISLIYAKSLQLPAGLYDDSAALTLMSTDIDRLAVSLDCLNEIWARLIEMSVGVWLLQRQLGWICVAPLVIVLGTGYLSSLVAKRIGPRQAQWIKAIQKRVGATSSMLGSMKSLKMMGLSDKMFDTLHNFRVEEIKLSKHFRWMSLFRMLLSFFPTILSPVACFVIFAIQVTANGSERLTAGKAFPSLAIIVLLTGPASSFLSSLPTVAMSTGCLIRIQKFLLVESCTDIRNLPNDTNPHSSSGEEDEGSYELKSIHPRKARCIAVSFKDASIPASSEPSAVLHDINFEIEKESLTMIVGIVGSGKSTLLKAIIGELNPVGGAIYVDSKNMAYCAQTPWLPNSTVRQIVCGYHGKGGEDDDQQWYNTVLHTCAFDDDVRLLPDRDETIIGSRGAMLSGGQKQRLALARAVYSRHRIIVLDDILSAIDARTRHVVVERLFGKRGLLTQLKSTIILATHAVSHLSLADKVIVIGENGRIEEQGTFDQLRSQDGFVSKLLLNPELLKANAATEDPPKDISGRISSPITIPKALSDATKNDVGDPTRRVGDIAVYKYYLKAIGWRIALVAITCCMVYALAEAFAPIWVTFYSDGTISELAVFISIYILAALCALSATSCEMWNLYMRLAPKSGLSLHRVLLQTVIRAPQSFFDETDSGVTLNRFSQDMSLVDGQLPTAVVLTVSYTMQCLSSIGLIALGSIYMALTVPALLTTLYFLQRFYLRTSRQMRFLDLECKSPLYTHFAETIEGLSTIRAFGWQHEFTNNNLAHLDVSQKPFYLLFCIQRWLNLFLLLLVGVTAMGVVTLATSLINSTSPGRLGVSLISVIGFNTKIAWLMSFWIQLETALGAISRLKGFAEGTIPEEKPEECSIPCQEWPSKGEIEFRDVSASYGNNPPALQKVSFTVKHGEKIGICGRTGSGKSSLLSILLRILNNSTGKIFVDSLDLSTIPREIIRSRIITIPQEPFILPGTSRLNANPSSNLSDDLIIAALTKVGLWSILEARGGLDADMKENPLSQGQQQIFCLARAMLRTEGKILVLDEATSNVDQETDRVLQRLIRSEFGDWTILTVAHRLDTILDSDRILVLDKGKVVENGRPDELIAKKGVFWELRGRI